MDILLVLFGCLSLLVVHGLAQSGFISIDCGLAPGSDYTDDKTQISYTSDAEFIDTGKNYNVSGDDLSKQLMNVRSFPEGERNCYTLKPEKGKDDNYLIRAIFMYGNYDSKNQPPVFKLYLGVDEWETVNFNISNSNQIVRKEVIHVPKTDYIDVCLVNNGSGTPFISALELRQLGNSIYNKTEPGSLLLFNRWDFGAEQGLQVRYKDDVFDRIWNSFRGTTTWESISAGFESNTYSITPFKLPGIVMTTAVTPKNRSQSLRFYWDLDDPSLKYYIYMHFSEVEQLQSNQSREFTIRLNSDLWLDTPVIPTHFNSITIRSLYSVSGKTMEFSLEKTDESTLPPIINALEVYMIKGLSQSTTDPDDVDAIRKIKSVYTVSRNWQGDPCLPKSYRWSGLTCNKSASPGIISLNLSSSNLIGKIHSSFSTLTSLQYLDLSYNNLTGDIPDFLGDMLSLNTLNLSGNNFTGSVPLALLRKLDDESLSLSLDGNPYLCKTNLCAEEGEKQKKKSKNVIVPVVASIASVLLLLAALAIFWRFKIRRQHGRTDDKPKEEKKVLNSKNQYFCYSEVVTITDNFQKVIGKGGFGAVYSGHLKDGTQVAVKMLSPSSTQGSKQFRAEAQLLTRVHHRNLASLIGYCDEGSNMGLIYEYMSNGNLQEHLLGKNASVLTWEQRIRIAIDAAQALEYLHDGCKPPIIHRDVKTANILLNEKMQAKVADFGLSRIFPFESGTHVSTAVVGTPGYLDPEYYITTRLNVKSDVFSFGVVLLELISGQPAIINSNGNKDHIVQWASQIISRGEIRGIVDPRFEGDFNTNSVWKAVETAMACVPSSSIQRATMSEVVGELKECLNIEIGHERTYSVKMESDMISSMSLEMVDLVIDEDAMGPQAR